MRKLIWLPLAGFLLVAGAAAAFASPGLVGSAGDTVSSTVARAGSFLQEVLDDLVSDGVISQEQSEAITTEVEARFEEKRAEMEQRREEMRQTHEQLRSFLEDGVISAEELAQLPEDHPLRNLDSYLEDGQLTADELRQLGGWGRPGFGFGPGRHGGPGWMFHGERGSDD